MVRSTHLARLRGGAFDVLVIGGGITGAGVVLEAAARGLSAALIERGDFAQGTSSWSTKLIHGGLRYLPMLDLAQVREGLEEQNFLLRNAPQLVRPLPFVLPLYRGATRPLGLRLPAPLRAALPLGMSLGLWTYDVLAGRRRGRRHRRLDIAAATALVPALRVDGLRRAFLYYDGLTDDGRVAFIIPWQGVLVVGTTDTEWNGPADDPDVTADDVAYLLAHASRFLTLPLSTGDVVGAYAGLRPLISAGAVPSARLSRRHEVV